MTPITERLKAVFVRRDATIMSGAPSAMFARVAEDIGYECVYVTGAGIANMHPGVPDIGLVTLSELADHVSAIADVVAVPLLVDGDTGFGNPINTLRDADDRTVSAPVFNREDQIFPKCGLGQGVIRRRDGAEDQAAIDAGLDGNFRSSRAPMRWRRGFMIALISPRIHRGSAGRRFVNVRVMRESTTRLKDICQRRERCWCRAPRRPLCASFEASVSKRFTSLVPAFRTISGCRMSVLSRSQHHRPYPGLPCRRHTVPGRRGLPFWQSEQDGAHRKSLGTRGRCGNPD